MTEEARDRPQCLDAIMSRRSVRRFLPDPVPTAVIEQLLAAAQAAPYGTPTDEREFVVLGGAEKDGFVAYVAERLDAILLALGDAPAVRVLRFTRGLLDIIGRAPVIVAVMARVSEEAHTLALPSAAVAIENLLLAATAFGLAGCYTTGGIYVADEICEYLGLPGRQLVSLVPLGYPAHIPPMKPRPEDAVLWRGFPEHPDRLRARAIAEEPGDQGDFLPACPLDGGCSILLVDEPSGARARLVALLEGAGYTVTTCEWPCDALEAIAQETPGAVIIDALLPEMSGYELCRRIRAEVDDLLPIVITSAAYNAADQAYGLTSGADAVLFKPVLGHELLATLHSQMRVKSLYGRVHAQAEELRAQADELRRANEQLRELERLRDDLTGMIVHDLRTPLTNVIGNLQTVQETDYDPELTREFVPVAIDAGQTLLGMVNDLLDISKLEAGQMPLEMSEFAVASVVDAALTQVRGLAEQKGLELRGCVTPPDLSLRADEEKVRRALVNLVGNAVKFTQKGHVWIHAWRENDEVLFTVEDTGEGIPKADRERIFAKFGQVETRRAGRRMSTGLGLTFVKLAAEAHGGRVWVDSELGKGSVFTMALPVGL